MSEWSESLPEKVSQIHFATDLQMMTRCAYFGIHHSSIDLYESVYLKHDPKRNQKLKLISIPS